MDGTIKLEINLSPAEKANVDKTYGVIEDMIKSMPLKERAFLAKKLVSKSAMREVLTLFDMGLPSGKANQDTGCSPIPVLPPYPPLRIEHLKGAWERGLDVKMHNDDVLKWVAFVRGNKGTLYEHGTFKILISFDDGFPKRAPRCQIDTYIYHPNLVAGKLLDLEDIWHQDIEMGHLIGKIIPDIISHPDVLDTIRNIDAYEIFKYDGAEFERRARNRA